jgi:hypothetical protein
LRTLTRSNIAITGLQHYRQSAERYTRKTQKEIRNLYETGISVPTLAKRFGGSNSSIIEAIKRVGGKIRPPQGKKKIEIPEKEVKEICELYKKGFSQTEIGRKLSRAQTTISRTLIENGIRTKTRTKHPQYKGGRANHHDGYIYVYVEPDDQMASMRTKQGYVLEHRLVLARKLGRPLSSTEFCHHIDGNRLNNDPINLELRQGQHGKGIVMRCLDCGSHNVTAVPLSNAI